MAVILNKLKYFIELINHADINVHIIRDHNNYLD